MLKKGFYCALGTPLDTEGRLLASSLTAEIHNQIEHGASGLLLMGTMGMLGCIRDDEYERIIKTAVQAVQGQVSLLVGAADNSIARLTARLEVLNHYPVSVVLTAPFYFQQTRETALNFFRQAHELSHNPLYLYDHPWTARYKITYEDVLVLAGLERYKGIKSGDMTLIKALHDATEIKEDFVPILSNSDLFAVGQAYGIRRILDGIFACFPQCTAKMQRAFDSDSFEGGKQWANQMMRGRDRMIQLGIWPSFSYAMNLLGFPGNFAPDYEARFSPESTPEACAQIADILRAAGEL